jgi:tRNA(Arg) A34 adenosine deaminase TadA
MSHDDLMRVAIQTAVDAVAHGNHPFGAVLVHGDELILRAENTVIIANDITNHAETNLVRLACQQYDHTFLSECTLYASTEPCAMCSGAIFWSGICSVVYGCSAQRLYAIVGGDGLHITCQEILSKGQPPVEVIGPILEDEAVQLHLTYWNRT